MIWGIEGRHLWVPAAAGLSPAAALAAPFTSGLLALNYKLDDSGDPIFPRYNVRKITGLQGSGDSGDRRDVRVGAQGEIPHRSFRRGKTITYEGLTQAQSLSDLRDAEAAMRAALDEQVTEGTMVVSPHPLYDASGDYCYFSARSLLCEIDAAASFSPARTSFGYESSFVVSLRNARALGVSYYDQSNVAYP